MGPSCPDMKIPSGTYQVRTKKTVDLPMLIISDLRNRFIPSGKMKKVA